jgi:hypothetical protein
MANRDVMVRSGEVVAQRLYDIAYAIDLTRAGQLWAEHLGGSGFRSRLVSAPAKAVAFGVPPLLLTIDRIAIDIDGTSVTAQASARLYDFGVIVLAVRFPVNDVPWAVFAAQFNHIDRTMGVDSSAPFWSGLLARVRTIVAPAFTRGSEAQPEEDYLLGIVHAIEPPMDAATLRESVDLVGLLSGESRPLSAAAQHDLLQRSFSYFADDLVVLTWDRAFIFEPRGDADVADVIEVANAQLVEFRYYDELLDRELPAMYDRVEAARRAASLLASRHFAQLARRLYTLVAEVTELTEKVDNALQVTEDVYLARVYAAALELFRVPRLSAAVDRKLSIIRDTYTALYEEASSRRSELLEIAIVVLILVELVVALLRH